MRIFAYEDVGEDDELAHHRDERELGRLSLGAETVVDGLEVGVEARGREGGQVAARPRSPRPPPIFAWPFHFPHLRVNGARPVRLAAVAASRVPSSCISARIAAAVTIETPGMLQRSSALRARPSSEATSAAIAASSSASARSICRRRVSCWRSQQSKREPAGAVRRRGALAQQRGAGELELVQLGEDHRPRLLRRAARSSRPCGRSARRRPRSLSALVPIASAKRRTQAWFSFEQGTSAWCSARSQAAC